MNLKNNFENKNISSPEISCTIKQFFNFFTIGTLLNQCGIRKVRGTSPVKILQCIFTLPFIGKNFYRGIVQSENPEFGKDAAYDLLKNPGYNWRRLLFNLAVKIISFFKPLTSQNRENVFIVDDSKYDRSRSKQVELLAWAYDHVTGAFYKGFRLLTLAWSDGVSTAPVDFGLLSSEKEKKRIQGITKELDKRTCGYKRRLEALTKATELVESMVRRAVSSGRIAVDFILMDSWFAWPKLISKLRKYADVICMIKKMPNILYSYKGQLLSLESIYRKIKKRRGRAKILGSAVVLMPDGGEAKIVFVRDRRKRGWLALLSTNTILPDEDIIRIYGRRWDIEVFFKMIKQHFNLAKEIQCRDFDGLIAHTTVVFMRYLFLSYEQRMLKDQRTFGDLFFACCDEMKDISLFEALHRILTLAIDNLRRTGEFSEKMYHALIEAVMEQAMTNLDFSKFCHKV